MPLIAVSILSIAVQAGLIVHVIKTGRNSLWIWAIALLPPAGPMAYVAAGAIAGPHWRPNRATCQVGMQRMIDPESRPAPRQRGGGDFRQCRRAPASRRGASRPRSIRRGRRASAKAASKASSSTIRRCCWVWHARNSPRQELRRGARRARAPDAAQSGLQIGGCAIFCTPGHSMLWMRWRKPSASMQRSHPAIPGRKRGCATRLLLKRRGKLAGSAAGPQGPAGWRQVGSGALPPGASASGWIVRGAN